MGEIDYLKQRFTREFYALWQQEGFGDTDLDQSEPWGCPWSWDHHFELDRRNPEKQARNCFDDFYHDIAQCYQRTSRITSLLK